MPGAPASPNLARALMDTSNLPLVLFDGELRVVCASRSFHAAFDIPTGQAEGRTLGELGGGEWRIPQLRLLLENAANGGPELGDHEVELLQAAKPPRRLAVNVRRVHYDDALNPRILVSIDEVTHKRRAERSIAALLQEKDSLINERSLLLDEMRHRVANCLQIVASVLLIKARAVTSEESRAHLRDAHDRVMSVAAVQQHLQVSAGDVELAPYLTKLCASLAASMIAEGSARTLEVRSDEATVRSREAVCLGLIVTELVINALKHAFPEGRGGRVIVDFRLEPPGWTLSVTDDGVGQSQASSGARIGLGISVVAALARQLHARVEVTDAGPGASIALINNGGGDGGDQGVAPPLLKAIMRSG